jgi:hypothetical protein
LGGFGELWNQTSDFIMFVCPSVSPHWKIGLPLDRFPWYFIYEYFSKVCQ